MGERLVVKIKENGKTLGSVYYHWSAYASSSLYELQMLKDILLDKPVQRSVVKISKDKGIEFETLQADPRPDLTDPIEKLINVLAVFGGGLDRKDAEFAKTKYPGKELPLVSNRNNGLVSISKEEIKKSCDIAEGFGYVDLTNKTVGTDCFFCFETPEQFDDEWAYTPKIVESKYNFAELTFDEIDETLEWFNETTKNEDVLFLVDHEYLWPITG